MKHSFARIMVLVTVILMDLTGGAEVDIFVPSFPELQSQFNLSSFWVEALLSVNFAGFCLSLFFVGGLADRYGRKPIITLGLMILIMGCIACLWASSYEFLLAGRFLQGLGIAAPSTLCFLIIADSYPLKKQQYLMAMMNCLMNVSVAAAPIIGSYITMYFHWQGNFMALLILGLLTLVMTLLFIPTQKLPATKEPLSLKGYIPLFQNPSLMLLMVNIVFMFVPYWIFIGMSPLLYMEDLGVSLAHFGFYQGALALVFALGSVLVGLMIDRYDQKKMLYISAQISIIALIIFVAIALFDGHSPVIITLSLLPFIIAQIIPSTILYPLCLNYLPHAKGRISAILQGSKLILSSIGLEFAGYFYQGSFQNIGLIISIFNIIAVITLFYVIKNKKLMKFSQD